MIRNICVALVAFFVLLNPSLEAGGWGKTDKVVQFDGQTWTEVYIDLSGLKLTASVPNYSGAMLQNNAVSLNGKIENAGYTVMTSYNPAFQPPKTAAEFFKLVQDANPDFVATSVDAKKFGCKYGVDIAPKNPKDDAYWRIFCTNDRLVKLGSDDKSASRRTKFFDSLLVK